MTSFSNGVTSIPRTTVMGQISVHLRPIWGLVPAWLPVKVRMVGRARVLLTSLVSIGLSTLFLWGLKNCNTSVVALATSIFMTNRWGLILAPRVLIKVVFDAEFVHVRNASTLNRLSVPEAGHGTDYRTGLAWRR